MMPQLVFTAVFGRETIAVEYFPAPSMEPTLGTVTRRIKLTEAESGLTLDQLKALYDARALLAQRKAA